MREKREEGRRGEGAQEAGSRACARAWQRAMMSPTAGSFCSLFAACESRFFLFFAQTPPLYACGSHAAAKTAPRPLLRQPQRSCAPLPHLQRQLVGHKHARVLNALLGVRLKVENDAAGRDGGPRRGDASGRAGHHRRLAWPRGGRQMVRGNACSGRRRALRQCGGRLRRTRGLGRSSRREGLRGKCASRG